MARSDALKQQASCVASCWWGDEEEEVSSSFVRSTHQQQDSLVSVRAGVSKSTSQAGDPHRSRSPPSLATRGVPNLVVDVLPCQGGYLVVRRLRTAKVRHHPYKPATLSQPSLVLKPVPSLPRSASPGTPSPHSHAAACQDPSPFAEASRRQLQPQQRGRKLGAAATGSIQASPSVRLAAVDLRHPCPPPFSSPLILKQPSNSTAAQPPVPNSTLGPSPSKASNHPPWTTALFRQASQQQQWFALRRKQDPAVVSFAPASTTPPPSPFLSRPPPPSTSPLTAPLPLPIPPPVIPERGTPQQASLRLRTLSQPLSVPQLWTSGSVPVHHCHDDSGSTLLLSVLRQVAAGTFSRGQEEGASPQE